MYVCMACGGDALPGPVLPTEADHPGQRIGAPAHLAHAARCTEARIATEAPMMRRSALRFPFQPSRACIGHFLPSLGLRTAVRRGRTAISCLPSSAHRLSTYPPNANLAPVHPISHPVHYLSASSHRL
jgi:hypothetical protein